MEAFFNWLKQSSTIRGILQVLSSLGVTAGWLTESNLLIIMGAISFILSGLYNMWRSDSVQKAVDLIKDETSKKTTLVFFALLMPLLLFGVQNATAADLFCSVEGTVTHFDVDITDSAGNLVEEKIEITDFVIVGPDEENGGNRYKIMNVDHLPPIVSHTFVVTACNNSWCETSQPYTTGRPRVGRVIVI